MEDGHLELQYSLEEINLGELGDPKVLYVSTLLEEGIKKYLISFLREYKH